MQSNLIHQSAGVLARHSEAELLASDDWKRSLSPAALRGSLSPKKREKLRAHNARQVAGVVPFPKDFPTSAEHGPRPALLRGIESRLHTDLAALGIPAHDAVTEINAALVDARAGAVQAAMLDAFEELIQGFSTYRPLLCSIRHVLVSQLRSGMDAAAAVPALVAQLADAEQSKAAALAEQAAVVDAELHECRIAAGAARNDAARAGLKCDMLMSELEESRASAATAASALTELRANNSSLVAAYRRNEVAATEAESKGESTGKELSDVKAALRAVETENRAMEAELERRRRDAAASVPILVHQKTKRSLNARVDELKELRASNARLQGDHVALVRNLRRRGAADALKRVPSQWMDKLASALDVRMAGLGEGVNSNTGALNLPGSCAPRGGRMRSAVGKVIEEGTEADLKGGEEEGGSGEEGEGGLNFQLLVRMLTRIEQLKANIKGGKGRRSRRNVLNTLSAAGGGGDARDGQEDFWTGAGLGTIGEDEEDDEEEGSQGGSNFSQTPLHSSLGSRGTVFVARKGNALALLPGRSPPPIDIPGGGQLEHHRGVVSQGRVTLLLHAPQLVQAHILKGMPPSCQAGWSSSPLPSPS
jgi:hypothetical protein